MIKKRILIVEDEFIIAHDLQGRLTELGYDVPVVLAHPEDIVERVREVNPDLILMDINLNSKIDGIQAAELVKDQLQVPVVYLTSYTDEKTLERAKLTDPFGYIVKPYQKRELATTIEMAIHKAEMDQRIKLNERRLKLILSSMTEALIAFDQTGRVTTMNPVAEKWTGVLLSQADPKNGLSVTKVLRLFDPKTGDPFSVENSASQLASEGAETAHTIELQFQGLERDFPVSATFSRIGDENGNATGTLFCGFDLTKQKDSEKRQKELEEQMLHVQKLESIGVLAGGIAHDFNNLLCVILGNASLLRAGAFSETQVQDKLKLIELTATRATDLVKQLLSYSGKAQAQMVPTQINDEVSELGTLLETSISKKAKLVMSLSKDELPAVLVDRAQLRQIIMNLIINASDALEDKAGEIKVRSGVESATRETLDHMLLGNDLSPGNYVFFEVKDTGTGMSPETRSKVFDPFFTTKFTGRGLGLSAVLGIIRGHGGALFLESELGKGTTFRVYFPATEHQVAASSVDPKKSKVSEGAQKVTERKSVLVVDDEGNILTVAKEILEQEGYQVLTAESGAEGVRIFEENQNEISAVVMDLSMKDMDGTEAYLEMKKNVHKNVPVLFTSGHHESEISERLNEEKVSFIQKPYLPNQLIEAVEDVVLRHQTSDSGKVDS